MSTGYERTWLIESVRVAMESLEDDIESDEYDGSEELLSRGVSYLLDELAVRYDEVVDEEKEIRLGFEERLYWRWGSAFDVIDLYIMLNTQAGRLFHVLNGIGDKGENEDEEGADPLLEALVSLHVRACQVSREVLALMRAGYADGAFSRWRALYEMAASAQFIAEHGEGTAKRFLNHKIVDDYYEAREYQEHSEALGFEQMKDDEWETLEETFEELVKEYGGRSRPATAGLQRTWTRIRVDGPSSTPLAWSGIDPTTPSPAIRFTAVQRGRSSDWVWPPPLTNSLF